eukprot:1003298-Alexandrium_andersonii.AAC.1
MLFPPATAPLPRSIGHWARCLRTWLALSRRRSRPSRLAAQASMASSLGGVTLMPLVGEGEGLLVSMLLHVSVQLVSITRSLRSFVHP